MIRHFFGYLVLIYLRFWAKLQLKKVNPLVIGVTGSVGKTSTRTAIATLLQSIGRVKEARHANSESGIPLNILGLSLTTYSPLDWLRVIFLAPFGYLFNHENYDYYLVELGIDSPRPPKNMTYLLTIVKPQVGIVLNARLVHSQQFDYLVKDRHLNRRRQKLIRLIAKEKGKLVTTMTSSDLAILNIDQPEIGSLASQTSAKVLTFGYHSDADIKINRLKKTNHSFELKLTYLAQEAELKFDQFPMEDNYAYTFAAAIAVGVGLGIPFQKTIQFLQQNYLPPAGRWRLFSGLNGTTLIDSSYNASPTSMQSALKSFHQLAKHHYKIAVVGDMRELGQEAKQAHKDLAEWLINFVDEAVLFGNLTRRYTLPILRQNQFPTHHFTTMDELIQYLRTNLKSKSWILFKGSQNTIFLERAVEALLLNKSDVKLLCRRGAYWDKIRSQTP